MRFLQKKRTVPVTYIAKFIVYTCYERFSFYAYTSKRLFFLDFLRTGTLTFFLALMYQNYYKKHYLSCNNVIFFKCVMTPIYLHTGTGIPTVLQSQSRS